MSNFLIPNVGAIQPQKEIRGEAALPKGADGGVFEKSLREKLPASAGEGAASPAAPLKFSSHAMHRIKDRSIALGQELMGKKSYAMLVGHMERPRAVPLPHPALRTRPARDGGRKPAR